MSTISASLEEHSRVSIMKERTMLVAISKLVDFFFLQKLVRTDSSESVR